MSLKLKDIIDVQQFQMIQDRLNEIYSFPSAIIDNEGKILTATAWQDLCLKFHRQNSESEKECIKSDQYIADHLHEANPAVSYRCPHGLIDNATPIIIEGVHYGNFFTGQFFLEPPDLNFFRAQAQRYSFNEVAYLEAVKKVPIWTQDQLANYLFFIKGLIEVISEIGLKNLKEIETRKRIQESEERFKLSMEATNDGLWDWNIKTDEGYFSPGYYSMLGYEVGEFPAKGSVWEDMIHPDDSEKALRANIDCIEGRTEYFEVEYRMKAKNGVWNWIFGRGKCVERDENGRALRLVGTHIDITERKNVEKALQKAEGLYRMIADNVSDILWTMDLNYQFTYVSTSIMKVRGFTVQEALSQRLEDMLTPASLQVAVQAIADEDERLKRHPDEFDIKLTIELEEYCKDGSTIWTENEINYLFDQDRRPIGIIGVTRDISKRKRIEVALRESEERFRSIVENTKEVIWMMDMNLRFTYINPYIEHNMGYTAEEFLRMPLDKIMTPTSLSACMHLLVEELENERRGDQNPTRSRMIEVEHIHKNGKIVYGEIKMTFIRDASSRAIGILGFTRDISENKRLETDRKSLMERLQRSEKMEALGQLAGGVAHDLNNVLGILSGYSELLLEEIPEGHRSRGHAEKILQSTEKGAAIIQDLLTLARRGVIASDVINLNSVITGFLKTPVFEKMKDYHPRVTFRTECDENVLNIKGSPVHLEKTLMNLVVNAAESISGTGEVTIRTESRYLDKAVRGYDEVTEGDYAVLTVSDTGTGIPAENREKIFEPFYTKKAMGRSGTGLGLSIVWGTVKDHHGYIDVQTEVGAGTAFTLYFPVTREELITQQQKPVERYRGNGESVLVVDDIAEQRDVAARLLTRLGYEVQVVSSGEEAVEYLKGHTADILVLDMIMAPGIDGLETYQRVLAINPKQKAILVSGFSDTERVREAQKLGAGDYVRKPYTMEGVGAAIQDELARK